MNWYIDMSGSLLDAMFDHSMQVAGFWLVRPYLQASEQNHGWRFTARIHVREVLVNQFGQRSGQTKVGSESRNLRMCQYLRCLLHISRVLRGKLWRRLMSRFSSSCRRPATCSRAYILADSDFQRNTLLQDRRFSCMSFVGHLQRPPAREPWLTVHRESSSDTTNSEFRLLLPPPPG